MTCPGSIAASEGLPDKTSFFAQEGTAAHEVVEILLSGDQTASDLLDTHIAVEGTEELILVTEEMMTACLVMVDYVEGRVEQALRQDEDTVMWLERSFDLAKINAPAPMFGTGDVVIWSPNLKRLHVIDYKHGMGVMVEVEENSQIMYYGLGATVEVGVIPDEIEVTIVQPRIAHVDGPCRSYTFGRERLLSFKDELFAAVEATLVPDAPLQVGDHCRFCKAFVGCPAQKTHALDTAMVAFNVEPEPKMLDIGALSIDEVATILRSASTVMNWLREVEATALELMETGVEVPGHKLVRGRAGNRAWIDGDQAAKYLAGKGLNKEERFNRKVISPSQAEKKLKAQGASLKHLDSLWTKGEGKVKITLKTDSRPAIGGGVARAFGSAEALPTQDEKTI